MHRLLEADRAEVAGLAAEMLDDFAFGREPESVLEARHFVGLDLVELMVAAHQQQPDLGRAGDRALGIDLIDREHQ